MKPAIVDLDLSLEAEIWAETDGHAWDLLVRLIRGVREHGRSGGPLVEWDEVSFRAVDDGSAQGAPCTAKFTMKALPIEPAAARTGEVKKSTLERI